MRAEPVRNGLGSLVSSATFYPNRRVTIGPTKATDERPNGSRESDHRTICDVIHNTFLYSSAGSVRSSFTRR